MSSFFGNDQNQQPRIGQRQPGRTFFGDTGGDTTTTTTPTQGGSFMGGNDHNAPILPRPTTVQPVQSNIGLPPLGLDDNRLGRMSKLLDAVRDRKLDWKKAKFFLDELSSDDKKTLQSVRGQMNLDEKRALGISKPGEGGSLIHELWGGVAESAMMGPKLIGGLAGIGGEKNPLHKAAEVKPLGYASETVGNLSTDTSTFVKDLPAGLVKLGIAGAKDTGYALQHPTWDPIQDKIVGRKSHTSEIQKTVINPTIKQYADMYGPLFRGHPLATLNEMHAHPLQPLLDAFAVASAGAGLAGRVGEATRAVEAGTVTKVSDTHYTVGKPIDRTNETYHPLGYNMEYYVRPTTQQIRHDPWMNHFSVLIDEKTGKAIFSPVGSSHDEIYAPMSDKTWPTDVHPEDHIQATGIFDPRTGKVARININPDDVTPGVLIDLPKMLEGVKKQAEDTYITKAQLKARSKANEGSTLNIHQDTAKKRYDPTTGEELPPTWYVKGRGQRVRANFPDAESAIAHAQSITTGGLLHNHLVNAFRPFYEMTPGETAPVAPGFTRIYRGQGMGQAPKNIPEWMLANQGNWFTADRAIAGRYGEGGQISFLDVPEDQLAQYSVRGGTGKEEFILPGEMAKTAQPVEGIAGPTRNLPIVEGKTVQASRNPFKTGTKTTPLVPKTPFQLGKEAFLQRPHGGLIDAYESARQISHSDEYEAIAKDVVMNILIDPEMRTKEQAMVRINAALKQIVDDMAATKTRDIGKYHEKLKSQPEFQNVGLSAATSALGISIREASDLVRAGAIFLRPAYIPNNWAGNAFLNAIHQGVFAPLNLAKALMMDKHIGTLYTRGIDQSMGFNAASLMTSKHGTGYVAGATDPLAKLMGSIADQPFRRAAWIHEARRAGYKSMYDVQRLWDQAYKEKTKFENRNAIGGDISSESEWLGADTPAIREITKISRAAQEEIVKFGKYNDIESGVLRNLIFVYSWMRGAARYFGRFPLQHPIQAAAYNHVAGIGQNWLDQELGGVPNFLIGAIPVGKDDKGNTRLINPFSVNPLGTGQQMIASAVSFKEILTHPDEFNKFRDTDPTQLLNPLVQNLIESYTGGRPWMEANMDTIAALRMIGNLQHPGRGQIYPTTKTEAVAQFTAGTLFPRQSSQAAITRSLQRQNADQPELLIDDEVKAYQKATGQTVPKELIDLYKQDLEKVKQESDFQHSYAKDHGSQGFSNMPPRNRAEAALKYLEKYNYMTPDQATQTLQLLDQVPNDEAMNSFANSLWNQTGSGHIKARWTEMIHGARDRTQLTPERP
jgi:hypothetical protein